MRSKQDDLAILDDTVDQSRVPKIEVAPEVLQTQQGHCVGLRVTEPAVNQSIPTDLDRTVLGGQLAG